MQCRQVVAKHLPAGIEKLGIQNENAILVVNPRPGAFRLHEGAEQGRHHFRVDRRGKDIQRRNGGRGGFARLQFQQLVGVDGNGVDFHRCLGSDRAGNDLALGGKAVLVGFNQPLPELVEIKNARQQHGKRRKIEKHDPLRQ